MDNPDIILLALLPLGALTVLGDWLWRRHQDNHGRTWHQKPRERCATCTIMQSRRDEQLAYTRAVRARARADELQRQADLLHARLRVFGLQSSVFERTPTAA